MSKISVMLDTESVEYDLELNKLLFKDFDNTTTVVELYERMDLIWETNRKITAQFNSKGDSKEQSNED